MNATHSMLKLPLLWSGWKMKPQMLCRWMQHAYWTCVRYFIRSITRHKRTAATHVLVTMISPSERNVKPYALPVSCIPYTGLAEGKARKIINMVVKEMCKHGMKVEGVYQFYPFVCLMCYFNYGFVSNGEYNTFRSKGYTRPLSIFQLRSSARNSTLGWG